MYIFCPMLIQYCEIKGCLTYIFMGIDVRGLQVPHELALLLAQIKLLQVVERS